MAGLVDYTAQVIAIASGEPPKATTHYPQCDQEGQNENGRFVSGS